MSSVMVCMCVCIVMSREYMQWLSHYSVKRRTANSEKIHTLRN